MEIKTLKDLKKALSEQQKEIEKANKIDLDLEVYCRDKRNECRRLKKQVQELKKLKREKW